MHTVVGPVVVTREGGSGFDLWTPEEGLSRGFSYRRIEDAYYAAKWRSDPAPRASSACGGLQHPR
jgi:hypothetical protein